MKRIEPIQDSALYDSCGNGNYPDVKRRLAKPDIDLNLPHGYVAWTMLHYASYYGHTKIVKLLLIKGASPHILDRKGWSPIDYASREKHRDVVRILQDEGAVLAVLEQLEERRKQHEAAIAKLPEVKKKRNLFVDPEKEKEEAAADGEIEKESHSRENIVKRLLEAGADFYLKDMSGRAPYDYAKNLKERYEGEKDTILEMITNEENKRMKHIKVSRLKKVSLVSASVECMKDKEPEWSNQEVYHDDDDDEGSNDNSNDSKSSGVVYNGNDNKVEDSVSSVKENRLNEQELYNASGSDKLMYILEHFLADLDVGCSAVDVNCKPYDAQRTPLHNAAYCGAVDCADCLLQWGARVDELDYTAKPTTD